MKTKLLIILIYLFSPIIYISGADKLNDKITVNNLIESTPYLHQDENSYLIAFSKDVTRALMDVIELPFSIESNKIENNEDEDELNKYNLWIISNYSNINDITTSLPFLKINYDILTTDTMHYHDYSDLKDKKIILKRTPFASNVIDPLGENYFKHIIYTNNAYSGIKLLTEGYGDYFIADEILSKNISDEKSKYNIVTYKSELPPFELYYASTDENLIKSINRGLGKLHSDKTFDYIYDKWFGIEKTKSKTWYIYLSLILIISILILVWIVIYIYKKLLRKAINKNKKAYNKIYELNQSLNLLARSSHLEIFMFDIHEQMLYYLEKGEFTKKPLREDQLLEDIHPEDIKKYQNDYLRFLENDIDIMTASLRVYNKKQKKYNYYEYVLKPLKKDFTGKTYRFIFSRKNETRNQEKIKKQKDIIKSLNLALRSASLIRWQYNIKKNTLKFINSNYIVTEMSESDFYENICLEDRNKFSEYLIKASMYNEVENIIIRIKMFNSEEYKPFEISSLIKYDNEFNPIEVYGIMKDLSEMKFYQDKIYELKNNIEIAIVAGNMSVWNYDRIEETFIILNGPGINGGKMTKEEYLSFSHPEDKNILFGAMQDIFDKKIDKTTVEFRLNINDTGWKWYSCSLSSIPTDQSNRYVTGTRKDITQEIEDKLLLEKTNIELKRSNELHFKNKMLLELILNQLPIPIYIKDPINGTLRYINEEAKKLFNITIESPDFDFLIEDYAVTCREIDKMILESGDNYIANELLYLKSGEVKNTFVKKIIIEINDEKRLLVVRTDLSQQYKYQIKSDILLKTLSSLNIYVWNYNTKTNIINFGDICLNTNRDLKAYDGLSSFLNLIHPDDKGAISEMIAEYLQKGTGEYNFIYRMDILEDGKYEWWESKSVVETKFDDGEEYIFISGVEMNINDKILSQQNKIHAPFVNKEIGDSNH